MTTIERRRTGRPPMSDDRTVVRDLTVALRMKQGEKQKACALASHEGRSLSNFVRYVYLLGLAQYEAEQARTATHA